MTGPGPAPTRSKIANLLGHLWKTIRLRYSTGMTWKTLLRAGPFQLLAACGSLYITALVTAQPCLAEPIPTPPTQSQPSKVGLPQALGINELKLQMAESTYKLRPSIKTLSDLISSLEEVINATCLAQLPRTLSFPGKPSDPTCVGYMERLLELYPENPVGLCLRDGIDAPSCADAYKKQAVAVYDPSQHDGGLSDPSLRIGLTRQEDEKLQLLSEALANLNQQYQSTQDAPEKQRLVDQATDIYDQALAISCRITGTTLIQTSETFDPSSDAEIRDIRQKLLPLPQSVREDHQGRMLSQAEEKLKGMKVGSADWKRQQGVIQTIKRPDLEPIPLASSLQRTRLVLATCAQFIQEAAAATQGFPAPTCHKDGWYTPQCIQALKSWRSLKAQRKAVLSGTPGAPARPTSVISTF